MTRSHRLGVEREPAAVALPRGCGPPPAPHPSPASHPEWLAQKGSRQKALEHCGPERHPYSDLLDPFQGPKHKKRVGGRRHLRVAWLPAARRRTRREKAKLEPAAP